MVDAEALRVRLGHLEKVKFGPRIALLDELLGRCGPDEAGPVALSLIDMAIVPAEERPRPSAPRLIRLFGRVRRKARAEIHLAALASLVRHWSRVPQDLHHVVLVAGRDRLAAACRCLATSPVDADRLSVCSMAGESGEYTLAETVAGLFSDREASIAGASERTLMNLALALSVGHDPGIGAIRDDDGDRGEPGSASALVGTALVSVLGLAARERRRPAVVGAMALLDAATVARARAGRAEALGAWFLRADEECRGALRAALRATEGEMARGRALEWLAIDWLSAAALERLSRARSLPEHERVLACSHLLVRPSRGRRAAMLGRSRRGHEASASPLPAFVPAPAEVPALHLEARRGLARYLHATGTGMEVRRRVCEPLLADPDVQVRYSCVRVAPPSGLVDQCFDPDPRVARSAALSWSLVGERAGGPASGRRLALRPDAARERMLGRLARSPHRSVRALAREEIALLAWLDPRTAAGRAAARRRLEREPEALISDLRAVLLAGETDDRVAAVQTVRSLGLHAALERELLGLCDAPADGPRARVAATALAALAELGTPTAARAVTSHVAVADARVRANAVEGVGVLLKRGAELGPARTGLIEVKDDPNHRVRANAIRALLARPGSVVEARSGGGVRVYEPAAVESLLSMLGDARGEHRLAGSWAAGRVLPFDGAARLGPRWAEVSVRVHELAAEDPDPRVRVRAAQCAGLLRGALRSDAGVLR